MPQVSIVIPVFNVEPYILRCVESVASQTYSDIETIIVDDCGTDNSITLVSQYIAEYHGPVHFHIIHHDHNRGLSASRNTGISSAVGNYIFFLDSDDWINSDCIELMMNQMMNDPYVEMVMGDIIQEEGHLEWGDFIQPGTYSEDIISMACSYKIYTMAWNKLFKRKFILENKLFFKEGLYHEDMLWNIQVACYLKKFASIGNKTYHYLIRSGSIQNNSSIVFHYKHKTDLVLELLEFIFSNNFLDNRSLYLYVDSFITFEILECNEPIVKSLKSIFYHRFRNTPFWSFEQLSKMNVGVRHMLKLLNRYMPEKLGSWYYQVLSRM